MDAPSVEPGVPECATGALVRTRAAAWIWPIRFPSSAADAAWSLAAPGARLFEGWLWLPVAVLIGTVPLLVSAGLGEACSFRAWHQGASAFLLFLLLAGALRLDRPGKGIAAVVVAYAAHSAMAIALSAAAPAAVESCFPGGADYWQKQIVWIRTGKDPEYEPSAWIPDHFLLAAMVAVMGYVSLGLFAFFHGFHQVDLMNHYVGRLMATSRSAGLAFVFGWHVWSVARGVSYALIVYEAASVSLARMSGRALSPSPARAKRRALAVAFFFVDCILKYALLETVRGRLAANLAG